jgi:hypothetical protein
MMRELKGFTAYLNDEKDCLGLVDVHSNMGDLSEYTIYSIQQSYLAEISFLETNCMSLVPANPLHLTLRNNDERPGQKYETWKITGQTTFPDNVLKINLSLVKHYINGDEHIYWDPYKYIHRINGIDYMEETRKNLAME